MPDLIVGTKSPTANQGTIEIWQNDDAATPAFAPGDLPAQRADPAQQPRRGDRDGARRLRRRRTHRPGGRHPERQLDRPAQLMFFRNVSKGERRPIHLPVATTRLGTRSFRSPASTSTGTARWTWCVGTQRNNTSGNLQQWGNKTTFGVSVVRPSDREVNAPGIVLSVTSGDFGGSSGGDLAGGLRAGQSHLRGRGRVYFCDALKIPSNGTDPSSEARSPTWCPRSPTATSTTEPTPRRPGPRPWTSPRESRSAPPPAHSWSTSDEEPARALPCLWCAHERRDRPRHGAAGAAGHLLLSATLLMSVNVEHQGRRQHRQGLPGLRSPRPGSGGHGGSRSGDVPLNSNARQVAKIFNTVPGTPVLGVDSVALATAQPVSQWLPCSTAGGPTARSQSVQDQPPGR